MKKPWSGRFEQATDDLMIRFSESVSFDRRLYAYDIQGSIAHCKTLQKAKLVTAAESKQIIGGLQSILKEIDSGRFEFKLEFEDVHMNIEQRLIKKIGSAGGKLHTGRSRNDQVALDLRLYLRDEITHIERALKRLGRTLIGQAKKHVNTIIPGYTHLQRAQPVSLAHHLLAYVEMLGRDRARLNDMLKRVNVMPLGSAALAGSGYPLDRHYTARLLKFPAVTHNSMDAVSDRDFVVEFLAAASLVMAHLSRLGEEVILWSTSENKLIELSDAFSTGSSIMPQKKNPDPAELVRGKTGRVYGHLMGLLTLLKGQPLAYNRDMQEDKEPLFDTVDTVQMALDVFDGMMKSATFKPQPVASLEASGFLTATEIADYLVLKGMPFRDAHEVTGKTVAYCLKQGKGLTDLTLGEFQQFSPKFKKDIFDFVSIEGAVDRKNVYGGTARNQVREQLKRLTKEWK
ncbi:argininosuccinate lyase [Nitrospina watsonii]|uniref:Argininosuccinate lyase n=1 Tax=Nitrospina watsonii TaxID=1323948 RepID=A0ABM9HHA7_9BACT|nr:argininosuccinate lyase [Nitrospina watsonii]CAI2719716.1 Argininosuccinate lyase [Nitrospina watsonii]